MAAINNQPVATETLLKHGAIISAKTKVCVMRPIALEGYNPKPIQPQLAAHRPAPCSYC